MTDTTDESTGLALLGDALSWALGKALAAYERSSPDELAKLMAGVHAGHIRLRLTVTTGGGVPSTLEAAAIDKADTVWALAAMSIAPVSLN